MNWERTVYGYDKYGTFIVSKGAAPNPDTGKYRPVWSAFDGLPPNGKRIEGPAGGLFLSEADAKRACEEMARYAA